MRVDPNVAESGRGPFRAGAMGREKGRWPGFWRARLSGNEQRYNAEDKSGHGETGYRGPEPPSVNGVVGQVHGLASHRWKLCARIVFGISASSEASWSATVPI